MHLKKNILANYLGTGFVVATSILALPYYLSELGPALFGLVAFVSTFQAVLGMLDAGLGQSLVREVAARCEQSGEERLIAAKIVRGFELAYWCIALLTAAVILSFEQTISNLWLGHATVSADLASQAVVGAAAIFAVQFPGSVYRSVLIATQAQVKLNIVAAVGALTRNVGGVFAVARDPTLETYLLWQFASMAAETFVRAMLAKDVIRQRTMVKVKETRVDWKLIIRTTSSISAASVLSASTIQMDRVVLSRVVDIEEFGYYVIASNVALGLLQLIYPMTQALLPVLIKKVGEANRFEARRLLIKASLVFLSVVAAGGLAYISIGRKLLSLWLENDAAVAAVFRILSVLLIGTSLNAIYNIGYMDWLSKKKFGTIFKVNVSAFFLSICIMPPLVVCYGTTGAAFGWLVLNLVGFSLSLGWVRK